MSGWLARDYSSFLLQQSGPLVGKEGVGGGGHLGRLGGGAARSSGMARREGAEILGGCLFWISQDGGSQVEPDCA